MSITSYLRSLLPSFAVSNLKESVLLTLDALSKQLLPAIKNVNSIFDRKWKYKDKTAKHLVEYIESNTRITKLPPQASAFEIIEYVTTNALTTLPYIKTEIEKNFGRAISNSGLTFTKANYLQYCEVAEFYKRFTAILLNFVTAAELNGIEGKQRVEGVGPDDVEWLSANVAIYTIALRVLSYDVNTLRSEIRNIPDMVIDSSTEQETKMMVGASRLDPFGFASLPFPISVIYHCRLRGVEKDAEAYEELKAEQQVIEYRILLIKQRIENGQGDAAIEKLLTIQEERLLEQRRKIAKLEEEYGI